jgi:hypothetical protein
MNKLLIAVAAAFFAVTALFGSGAQAGFNVRLNVPAGFSTLEKAGCGGGGYYRSYRKRSYRSVRRSVKRKVHVASKPAASSVSVAKAEPETEAKAKSEVAQNENSSIATVSDKVAETETAKTEKKVAVAKDVGCKQFFPSVGMTLTVSCD